MKCEVGNALVSKSSVWHGRGSNPA